jgi:hypothetical protein
MRYDYCANINAHNIVELVIVCNDADWAESNFGGRWIPVSADNYCGIGWLWDGEKFNPPEPEIGGEE